MDVIVQVRETVPRIYKYIGISKKDTRNRNKETDAYSCSKFQTIN